MPGKIRILADKLDSNTKRSHKKNAGHCLCQACKGDKPLSFYGYKGKTYRKQIEKGLEEIEYIVKEDQGYVIYEWK